MYAILLCFSSKGLFDVFRSTQHLDIPMGFEKVLIYSRYTTTVRIALASLLLCILVAFSMTFKKAIFGHHKSFDNFYCKVILIENTYQKMSFSCLGISIVNFYHTYYQPIRRPEAQVYPNNLNSCLGSFFSNMTRFIEDFQDHFQSFCCQNTFSKFYQHSLFQTSFIYTLFNIKYKTSKSTVMAIYLRTILVSTTSTILDVDEDLVFVQCCHYIISLLAMLCITLFIYSLRLKIETILEEGVCTTML